MQASTQPKRINTKESVIDLTSYVDKKVSVQFVGGRQVSGVLKGADPICNLVLDSAVEHLEQGGERAFGIMIARGTSVQAIMETESLKSIENPYAAQAE
jgi:U6 snRNA-associated Sm-like protein LSm7